MKLSKLTCAVLSVIALSACGGGGGGGSSGSHNNQEEPQPIEETGVVVQDFQFNAFSSLDAAEVVTGGNFDSNSKTTVCLDLSHDNSCQDEQYSVSGTGLSFSNKLEWPEDLDVSGMNIIADNNNFVYSIPADSGVNDVAAQGTSVQKRIKVYINPASNALHADKLGKDVILGGYSGNKYSSSDFSAQKDYSTLDQEIITFADTLVSVLNYSNKKKLSYTEVRDIVSGALQKIIDALKDLSVSPVQIVVSVDTHNDYNHFANNGNPEVPVTNNPPVADFNFEVRADGVVKFSNNSSDPENDKLTYKWKFGDNAESDEASPNHKYKNNGKYTVYLNVTDPGNLSSYITKEVNVDSISEGGNDKPEDPDTPVQEENNAPTASYQYTATTSGNGWILFSNDSSDPDNDKLTYIWDFGDGSGSNEISPRHQFKHNGMFTVSLTVVDPYNSTSSVTKNIIISDIASGDFSPIDNKAPVANFSYEDTNAGVIFSNSSSDPNNDKLTYKWIFGDGSESFVKSPSHRYEKSGRYSVSLVVTDTSGLSSYSTQDIYVEHAGRIDGDETGVWYRFREKDDGTIAITERTSSCYVPYSEEKFSYFFKCDKVISYKGPESLNSYNKLTKTYSCALSDITLNDVPMTPISASCDGLYYGEIGSVADNYIPENNFFKYQTMILGITEIPYQGNHISSENYVDKIYKFTPGEGILQYHSALDFPCFVPYINTERELHPSSGDTSYGTSSISAEFMPLSFCGVDGILGKELVYVEFPKVYGRFPYNGEMMSWPARIVDYRLFPPFYPSSSWKYYGDYYRTDGYTPPNIIGVGSGGITLTLVIADGVNFTGNDAEGKFYFGDDPSTAVDFKNGQFGGRG